MKIDVFVIILDCRWTNMLIWIMFQLRVIFSESQRIYTTLKATSIAFLRLSPLQFTEKNKIIDILETF